MPNMLSHGGMGYGMQIQVGGRMAYDRHGSLIFELKKFFFWLQIRFLIPLIAILGNSIESYDLWSNKGLMHIKR